MADVKIILAHCEVTGQKFVIEVHEKMSRNEAVNFIDIPDSRYENLSSNIAVEGLESASNLLACKYCRSRKVAGCSCNRKHKQCGTKDKYDFQCLYCECLKLTPPKSQRKKIYVTSKRYDNIAEVLDSMNLPHESFSGKFDCDILFINCGTKDTIDSRKLAEFVKYGGCLYASDWAGEFVNAAFPGMISLEKKGKKGDVTADVIDLELMQITGRQIKVSFDLSKWQIIKSTKAKILLRASQSAYCPGVPIMISFTYGKGVVFYTSFHNHKQASEKEKMLLQLLLLKQMGAQSNQSIEQVGELIGLNISMIKDRFKK